MSKKVTIFTLLPLFFSFVVFSYTDLTKGSLLFIGGTLLLYLLINLYFDYSNKSVESKKIRGFSAYLGFILISIYLIVPVFLTVSPWIAIFCWILMMVVAFVLRETFAAAILSNSKKHRPIKITFWVSAALVIMMGGGGYYPTTKRVLERLGENTSDIYFAFIYLFFSLWFIIFAQSTTTRFTKFNN